MKRLSPEIGKIRDEENTGDERLSLILMTLCELDYLTRQQSANEELNIAFAHNFYESFM